jgi:hypothetical protein
MQLLSNLPETCNDIGFSQGSQFRTGANTPCRKGRLMLRRKV